MKSTRTLIIDDEQSSIELLETLLDEYCPNIEVVGHASSVKEGIELIHSSSPDLLFLDIDLPDGEGFKVLESTRNGNYQVIFTTAYNEYAIRAFEHSALHYLLKPINIDKLIEATSRYKEKSLKGFGDEKLDQLKQSFDPEPNKLALANMLGYEFVEISSIIRVEGEQGYSRFYFKDKKELLVSKAIGEYEKLLKPHGFFRVHKKHIINPSYLISMQKGKSATLLLEKGHQVPLSSKRKLWFISELKGKVAF
ncbi:LytR/AlgR family response regulator transcription factor [Croceimicrobium sp.]|uniref:LytR/AlgR family response regulator transcription factor n=1 Tax=Croceimicrobium sp. TaxID=2828340 RepID=UPI003BACC3B9